MKNELTLKELLFGEVLCKAVSALKVAVTPSITLPMREYGYPVVVEKTGDNSYVVKGITEEGRTQTVGNIPTLRFTGSDVHTPGTWKTAISNGLNAKRLISEIADCDSESSYSTESLYNIGYDEFDVIDDLMSAKGRSWRRYTAIRLAAHSVAKYMIDTIHENDMTSMGDGHKKFAWFTPFVKLVTADFSNDGKLKVHFKLWGHGDGLNFGPSFIIDPKNKAPEDWMADIETRICRSLLKREPDKYVVDWLFTLTSRVRLVSKDYPNVPESLRSKLLSSELESASWDEHLIAVNLLERFTDITNVSVPKWMFIWDAGDKYEANVIGDSINSHETTPNHTIYLMAPVGECDCPVFSKAEGAILKSIQSILESLSQ